MHGATIKISSLKFTLNKKKCQSYYRPVSWNVLSFLAARVWTITHKKNTTRNSCMIETWALHMHDRPTVSIKLLLQCTYIYIPLSMQICMVFRPLQTMLERERSVNDVAELLTLRPHGWWSYNHTQTSCSERSTIDDNCGVFPEMFIVIQRINK